MKKIIYILSLLLVCCLVSKAQLGPEIPQYLGSSIVKIVIRGRLRVDSVIYAPLRDTNFIPQRVGAIVVRPQDSTAYLGISLVAPQHWQKVGSGAVTSLSQGFGVIATPNPVIATGSVKVDTSNITSRLDRIKLRDSLVALINAKGTVSSISQGYGITNSPNPIVGSGSVTADTTKLIPYTDTLKTLGIATQTWVLAQGYGSAGFTFPKPSIVAPANAIQLLNDSSLGVAKAYYYGSDPNGNGRRGYYNLLTATQDTLIVRNGLTYIPGTSITPDTLQFNNGGHIAVVSNVAQLQNDSTFATSSGVNFYYGVFNGRPGYYPAVATANSIGQTITSTANVISLVNDQTSPGNNFYYRTSGAGTKQWAQIDAASIPDISASYIKNQVSQQTSASWNVDGTGQLGNGDQSGMPSGSKFNSIFNNSGSGTFLNGAFRSNQTGTTSGSTQGVEGYVKSSNASGNVTLTIGTVGNAEHAGAGTISTMRGGQFGTVVNAGGTVTIAQSVFIAPVNIATGSTTVTNGYGVYVDVFGAGSGAITNKWNIYTADATAKNELNGNVQLDILASGGSAPTTSGTTKTVITDANGLLSFQTSSGRLIGKQILTAGTSYTPTAGTSFIDMTVIGGGAGGGGAVGLNSNIGDASGGGAGGICIKKVTVTNTTYTYAIGAAGNGGAAGNNNGTDGTATSITISGTTYTANGGSHGLGSGASTGITQFGGGAGGTSTNGDINVTGQSGTWAFRLSSTNGIAGDGGSTLPYGTGGHAGFGVAGANASGYGSGGSGAHTNVTGDLAGGNGTQGVIIIYEYSSN